MFTVYEKVVYPGHGVAEITRIIEKHVAGQKMSYFELKFLSKDMTILVPTSSVQPMSIRSLATLQHIDDALNMLMLPARRLSVAEFTASCWNRRNKEYQTKLRTGSMRELVELYRDLRSVEVSKGLSFGERGLLSQAEFLLVEEISLVLQISHEDVTKSLRSFSSPIRLLERLGRI